MNQGSVAIYMVPKAWGPVVTLALPLHPSSKMSSVRLWAKYCHLLKVSRIISL